MTTAIGIDSNICSNVKSKIHQPVKPARLAGRLPSVLAGFRPSFSNSKKTVTAPRVASAHANSKKFE